MFNISNGCLLNLLIMFGFSIVFQMKHHPRKSHAVDSTNHRKIVSPVDPFHISICAR